MATNTRWRYLAAGIVLGMVLVGAVWAWTEGNRQPTVVQLPGEVIEKLVPVETVKEVPGAPTVVERIRTVTVPGEADPETLAALALRLCPTSDPPTTRGTERPAPPTLGTVVGVRPAETPILARVAIDADKHVGRDGDRIVAGWTGSARCETSTVEGEWATLHEGEFDETASVALSELAPELYAKQLPRTIETAAGLTSAPGARLELRVYGSGKRWGWYAAGDYVPDPERWSAPTYSASYYDGLQQTGTVTGAADSWVVAVGVARRWGKR